MSQIFACALPGRSSQSKHSYSNLSFSFFYQCLSVCICGSKLICHALARVLYIIAACGRPNWNPRDANSKSLSPAACTHPDGYHGPHTKISARAERAETGGTFLRTPALGRANAQGHVARRKDRATLRRLGLWLFPVHREPRLQGSSPRCRGKAYRFVRDPDAR